MGVDGLAHRVHEFLFAAKRLGRDGRRDDHLDGHIVLSRSLSDQGHYPAIDIEASVSRAITELLAPEDLVRVRRFKLLYSRFQRSRDLISVGAYVRGSDPLLDEAMALYPQLEAFLQQDMHQSENYVDSRGRLAALFNT